jgi:hypothetical protein
MSSTDATIRIKLGQIEIEYQGDASFLKKDLLETVRELIELQAKHPSVTRPSGVSEGDGGGSKFDHSTDTVATLLKAKSGPDLVIAAAAHLHFTKGKPKFTRQEIITEMRSAPGHFKETYVNNMTSYLTGLKGKDRLRLVGDDTYALSNKEKQEIETKLANA